jgi:hypothetical protein
MEKPLAREACGTVSLPDKGGPIIFGVCRQSTSPMMSWPLSPWQSVASSKATDIPTRRALIRCAQRCGGTSPSPRGMSRFRSCRFSNFLARPPMVAFRCDID